MVSIYLNGTTGGTDGTLEVPDDQVGVVLSEVGTSSVFHLRCTGATESTTQDVVVNAPTDCDVSSDGTTYSKSVTYLASSIGGVNVPCYIKRTGTTISVDTWEGLLTTPRLSAVTTTTA